MPTTFIPCSRRRALGGLASALAAGAWFGCIRRGRGGLRLAVFRADVTVPLGHGMMGGAWRAVRVVDPLEAKGFVLLGAGEPIVFVSVDWCEIRNEALDQWRETLAAAAGTSPERVLVSTVHQHDAPVADLEAERILRERGVGASICDPEFHRVAVTRVAVAVRSALPLASTVTAVGMGRARVEAVASNRRYVLPDGSVRWDRTSATRNIFAIEAGEGLVDPWLRTLAFRGGSGVLAATSFFAVHPMSYYGQGDVSADFPGLARRQREREEPGSFQIYVSGCSGNITAGRYNTGAHENRPVLAERLRRAMAEAWAGLVWETPGPVGLRHHPLHLQPRQDAGFSVAELDSGWGTGTGEGDRAGFRDCLKAMGLAWQRRVAAARPIDVPCLDLGPACLVVLPGEAYVEYQLAAQALCPDRFVCVAGYGDGATGYIPTERHWQEGDTNLRDWCWVAPGAEARMRAALADVLRRPGSVR